jgi:hypothetical protein
MHKFERKIFWRNIKEYVAGAIVVAGFGYYEWRFPAPLMRIGSGLIILATFYVLHQLHRRASAEPLPADLGRSTFIEFHRRQLIRQRDAIQSVWSWYLRPFVPGLAFFLAGLTQSAMNIARVAGHPLSALHVVQYIAVSASFVVVVFLGVWYLNRWTAHRLQAQIEDLEALTRNPD